MAKDEEPGKKPEPKDRAMDLLRRSSAGPSSVAKKVVHVIPPTSSKLFRRPAPPKSHVGAGVEIVEDRQEPTPAPEKEAESPSPSNAAEPALEGEHDPETETDAEVEKKPDRRRWAALLLLLLLLGGSVGLWAALRKEDDAESADDTVTGRVLGPAASVMSPPPASGADQQSGSGRGQNSSDRTARPASRDREAGVATLRFGEPGPPTPRDTAHLPAQSREGGFPAGSPLRDQAGGSARPVPPSGAAGSGDGGTPGNSRTAATGESQTGSIRSSGTAAGSTGRSSGGSVAVVVPPGPARELPAPLLDPAAPEACPDEPKDPVVLVFDGSVSMGLPLDMPLDLEAALDRRMDQGDEAARLEYRRWLATDQPKRLDYGKDAVRAFLQDADPQLSIGAVAFTACTEISSRPFVTVNGRPQLAEFIGGVTPHRGGDTALVQSIETALSLLQGRGRIVVLTDGAETCGGNLCAVASRIANSRSGVRVDVIDLAGRSNAACMTDATGGVLLNYAEMRSSIPLGRLLVRAANQCAAGDMRRSSR